MLLSVENLSFTYPGREHPALSEVCFTAEAGEYIAVLGANGSGKSTFARCVAGLFAPSFGSVRITQNNSPEAAGRAKSGVPVAMVFQSPADQIVAERVDLDIAFGPENLGLPRDRMRGLVAAAMDSFELSSCSDTPTHALTSGQKQHLALAGVHVLSPALLVLDEPTSMLGPRPRASVLDYLDRFHADGGTILHVTHDLAEARRADRVFVLEDGQTVFDGASAELEALPHATLVGWGLAADLPVKEGLAAGSADGAASGVGTPLLSCRDISCGPIRNFSLDLFPGTVTAITGESGSGKTLLLEILASLAVPDAGTIDLAPGVTAALAVQESEASLFAEFVADDVAYGPANRGLSGSPLVQCVRNAMEVVGLPFDRFADRRTFSLSGGERRKAALAGILAMDTEVVLLDEPSSALDVRSRAYFLQLVSDLKRAGKAVVFSTTRDEECAAADRVIALEVQVEPIARITSVQERTRDQLQLERLRKGAGGSWEARDTVMHRLPPLAKYSVAASCIAAAVGTRGWKALAIVGGLECIAFLLSRYPVKRLAVTVLKILPWLAFLVLLQFWINGGDPVALLFLVRFILLLVPLSVFVYTTSHTEIMYGMEDLLRPLALLGVPVRDLSLVTGLVFRFLPVLYGETARITAARIVRAAGSSRKKSFPRAVRDFSSLFVPLILRTLARADFLSQAIAARYYGCGKNSRYLYWKTGIGQTILTLTVPLAAGVLIFLSMTHRI